jgi:hypothetical protein
MIPRGEVGLIFANMGLTLVVAGAPVVNQSVFSALVVTVITCDLITPPALKWSFERFSRRAAARRSVVGSVMSGDTAPTREEVAHEADSNDGATR